jgi:hypothetical protein
LELLSNQLEVEMMLVEKLEAQEANLSRKTEVIALEKSELEDAVWWVAFFFREQNFPWSIFSI